jgi:hypothetical protein
VYVKLAIENGRVGVFVTHEASGDWRASICALDAPPTGCRDITRSMSRALLAAVGPALEEQARILVQLVSGERVLDTLRERVEWRNREERGIVPFSAVRQGARVEVIGTTRAAGHYDVRISRIAIVVTAAAMHVTRRELGSYDEGWR